MISFEYKGFVKVGGLGEAVGNLSKALARKGYKIHVLIPSHGVQKKQTPHRKLKLLVNYKGSKCTVAVHEFLSDSVHVLLFYGEGGLAARVLNDPIVYGENIFDKIALISRCIPELLGRLMVKGGHHIIHAHDWHAIPIALSLYNELKQLGAKPTLVLQIHLYCATEVSLDYLINECGLGNFEYLVYIAGRTKNLKLSEIHRGAKGILEKIGAYIADVIVTVSKSYLMEDEECLLSMIGWKFRNKSTYAYNGCDWKQEDLLQRVMKIHGTALKALYGSEIDRATLKDYLLKKALKLPQEEPIITDKKVRDFIYSFKKKPYIGHGRVMPFKRSGIMILTTGRATHQKGLDVLLSSIDRVIKYIPDARFLLLLIPLRDELDIIKDIMEFCCDHEKHVRAIFGLTPSIFHLSHLASDIFAIPSRWEPFGIVALEAMATGNVIVASKVGGLKETILDIRDYRDKGTGLLVPKEDSKGLADAIITLASLLKISEGKLSYFKKVRIPEIRELVKENPSLFKVMRENALRRAEEFRWNKVSNMMISAYKMGINLSSIK